MIYRGIALDPFQIEAIRVINGGGSVLVSAPTGVGKTLIAEYAIEKCIREGKRLVYTAPIKALSNQKFRDFTSQYNGSVGIKTGDVTINPDALIVLMTTEVFRNTLFDGSSKLDQVEYVVFDEVHFLDDEERGTVWEESIIFAPPNIKFICLSATVPNTAQLASWIEKVRNVPIAVVTEEKRSVPLENILYVPGMGICDIRNLKRIEHGRPNSALKNDAPPENVWRNHLVETLYREGRLPAIFFAFNRRECEENALSVRKPLNEESERTAALDHFDSLCRCFSLPCAGEVDAVRKLIMKGTAYHHAGLLPTLKEIVERLFTGGMIKLLFATETFALGVNMPAKTVVFNSIHKFNGTRRTFLKTREFYQMAGRAGRRGMDAIGYVYSVLEWPHIRAASAEKVLGGAIEPVQSRFNLSYSTILSLYSHLGDRISTACEKSFSTFQGKRSTAEKIAQMRKKIDLLRALGYIKGREITEKGRFAAVINGYELQATELCFSDFFHRMSAVDVAVILCAVIYEGKKNADYLRVRTAEYRRIVKATAETLRTIHRHEKNAVIADPQKECDFRLSPTVMAWMHGRPFSELERYTTIAPGDIIRSFRQTIQLVRQVYHVVDKRLPLRGLLADVLTRMNRDEVDAERQLRMTAE